MLIFDLGANSGGNLPYYLEKADRVVAVEANPALAQQIRENYSEYIRRDRLVVEEVALTGKPASSSVSFLVNDSETGWSRIADSTEELDGFRKITVPTLSVAELVERYGEPDYVKIDLEGHDVNVLRGLFQVECFPSQISVEVLNIALVGMLAGTGGYKSFKFVEGASLQESFKDFVFENAHGETRQYSFPFHSAGPFGDDIPGPWYSLDDAFSYVYLRGAGWYDIHARHQEPTGPRLLLSARQVLNMGFKRHLESRRYERIRKILRIMRFRFKRG